MADAFDLSTLTVRDVIADIASVTSVVIVTIAALFVIPKAVDAIMMVFKFSESLRRVWMLVSALLVIATSAIVILSTLRVEIVAVVSAILGVIGVAISFSMRSSIANFISGLVIAFMEYRTLNWIKIEGIVEGVIVEMDTFSVQVVAMDKETYLSLDYDPSATGTDNQNNLLVIADRFRNVDFTNVPNDEFMLHPVSVAINSTLRAARRDEGWSYYAESSFPEHLYYKKE